jgi:dUTP pyrophosphatase
MQIKVKRLTETAKIPSYATKGAACFDFFADSCGVAYGNFPANIRTGLSFEIPEGNSMLIFSRSGYGFKNDVRLANCVGVIDSDYRGEVFVKLTKDTPFGFPVQIGDRIAQGMIIPVEQVSFVESELSETERGAKGFGSSGR